MYKRIGLLSIAAALFVAIVVGIPTASANYEWTDNICTPTNGVAFCDEFYLPTVYKNQFSWAKFWKYGFNPDNGSTYTNVLTRNYLRLAVNTNATNLNYTNTDISTSEINNYQGNFLFGENTRVDVRMRYSANMSANPAAPKGAKGSAGLLFWNYFSTPVDPQQKDLTKVRDAFGFVWQDEQSFPNAGFWTAAVAQGVPGTYTPLFNQNLSSFHTYSLERRHDSMKYYIDGVLIQTQLLNQPGGITLPSTSKLSVDMWADNASYVLNLTNFTVDLDFNTITQKHYVDIDYVKVSELN